MTGEPNDLCQLGKRVVDPAEDSAHGTGRPYFRHEAELARKVHVLIGEPLLRTSIQGNTTMKKIIATAAAATFALSLAACDSPAEDAAEQSEDVTEAQGEVLDAESGVTEAQADLAEEKGDEATAEQLEQEADQQEETADEM